MTMLGQWTERTGARRGLRLRAGGRQARVRPQPRHWRWQHALFSGGVVLVALLAASAPPGLRFDLLLFGVLVAACIVFEEAGRCHLVTAMAQPIAAMAGLSLLAARRGGAAAGAGSAWAPLQAALWPTLVMLAVASLLWLMREQGSAKRAVAWQSREVSLARLLQDVAMIANTSACLATALRAASRRIGAFTGWTPGRCVLMTEDTADTADTAQDLGTEARPSVIVAAADTAVARPLAFGASTVVDESEAALCRIVCSRRQAALCGSSASEGLARAGAGASRLGVPVQTGEQIVAVMIFRLDPGAGLTRDVEEALASIGQQLGVVAERQQAQRQLAQSNDRLLAAAKMASLGEMAGGIAHEINNPLSVIQAYMARLAKYSQLPDAHTAIQDTIASVHSTILRITRIVNGLRAFTRDSEREPLESVQVAQLVRDTIAVSSERFRQQGIALQVAAVPANLYCECRPTQISQVLINLLNNAVDAVHGAAQRCVRLSVVVQAERYVFMVEDSGPGVPDALRSKILQPFFTTKPLGKGTGLGLSISNGIVAAHGGRLTFTRRDGLTVFAVSLPRYQDGMPLADQPDIAEESAAALEPVGGAIGIDGAVLGGRHTER